MVAYREAITKSVSDIDIKFIRQSGGRGQYGHVVINVEPNESGKGYHFENKIVGGVMEGDKKDPAIKLAKILAGNIK